MVANLFRVVRTFVLLSAIIGIVAAFRVKVQNSASNIRSHASSARKTVPKCGVKLFSTVGVYEEIQIPTLLGIHMVDITPEIRRVVARSGIQSGVVTVLSQHTTTAIVINEMEGRLVDDTRQFLLKLVPAAYPYLHNDLHLRDGPPNWPGGNEAWRAQEPVNAHSHLISMLLGASKSIPVHDGVLKIGTWQSIIMVELDGPRTRTVGIQVTGKE